MAREKYLAIFIVSLFALSGCIANNDAEVEVPQIELPDDWSTTTKRSIASPNLLAFTDCEELEDQLKSSISEEYRIQLLQAVEQQYFYGGWFEDDMMMDGVVAESSSDSASGGSNSIQPRREQGTDFSGTNNQEQGVDEADFVKTDGYYIYFLNGNTLVILGVPEFGELEPLSNTSVEGTPQAMMLDGDRLVVISTVSSWNIPPTNPLYEAMDWDEEYSSWRTSSLTKFSVFDISDRSNPDLERELFLEGSYITAREVNGTIRTVSHAWLNLPQMKSWLDLPEGYWDLDYEDPLRLEIREKVAYQTMLENQQSLDKISIGDIIPRVYERINGAVIIHGLSDSDCNDFVAPEDGLNRGFNSIFTFDLGADRFDFDADHIVGNYPMVYASQDQLILSENAWDWWWFWGDDDSRESTNLHTFDISNPAETIYTGSGRVDGTILNQFSLSEYQGIIRVATTEGQWARWWMEDPEPMSSSVVTLTHQVNTSTGEQSLEEVGKVDGIAPEERIWSARFDGDRAYLVTFRQIDPLWVIDLSNPAQPIILGELEIPGVSTYIHPLSKDALLTIGMGPAGEDGFGLDWSSTRLSIFDISDPTAPNVSSILSVSPVSNGDDNSWTWSYSEASYEHKAFQYWAPKDMLAIPLSTYRYNTWYDSAGNYHWNYDYVSKLMLVNIPLDGTNMTVHGEVNHSNFFNDDDNNYWWNDYNIRRSIFMGDYVYAISSGGVTATNLTSMEQSASVQLDYQSPYNNYYVEDVAVSESSTETDSEEESGSSTSSDGGAEPEKS
ncbi:MAG: beta-propeller domain-containing protein [Candidatus Poseidoniaceae archaeon]